MFETVCRDLNDNIIRDGNDFRPTADHCVDCRCLDGETECPIVDCPPHPGPGCIAVYEEGACCPTYICGKAIFAVKIISILIKGVRLNLVESVYDISPYLGVEHDIDHRQIILIRSH